jgi:uncharacterized protein YigE (DUF2233 family)
MKCLSLKHSGSETKILAVDDTRACIELYDAKSSTTAYGADSQVSSSPRVRHWATQICHNSHNTQAFLYTIKSISKT